MTEPPYNELVAPLNDPVANAASPQADAANPLRVDAERSKVFRSCQ